MGDLFYFYRSKVNRHCLVKGGGEVSVFKKIIQIKWTSRVLN